MSDTSPEQITVAAPVAVARALVQQRAASYPTAIRDATATLAAAITVVGVSADVISLALAREALLDLVRRLAQWGRDRDEHSELTLRVGDRLDVHIKVTGPENDEELVVIAEQLLAALSPSR